MTQQTAIVKFAGKEFEVRPPTFTEDETYASYFVRLVGEQPIAGPCAPNIDAYQAMLSARVNSGHITPEVRDRILSEIRENQKKALEDLVVDSAAAAAGDPEKDDRVIEAAKEVADAAAVRTINTFARDEEEALGFQSYAVRACMRELLSESGVFVKNRGKALRERFRMQVGTRPLFVRLLRDGKPIYAPDMILARPCHVKVRGQSFHSIKQREIVNLPWSLEYCVIVGRECTLTPEMIESSFKLLPTVKIGADRSQEYGGAHLEYWGGEKGWLPTKAKKPKAA